MKKCKENHWVSDEECKRRNLLVELSCKAEDVLNHGGKRTVKDLLICIQEVQKVLKIR